LWVTSLPAGTGQREFDKLIVGSRDDFEKLNANKRSNLFQEATVEE